MKKDKPQISIPDPVHTAVEKISQAVWTIVSVLVVGFITMLMMVAGLVLDAWRYKSNSYEGMIEIIRGQEKLIGEMKHERDATEIVVKEIRDEMRLIREQKRK